MKALVHKTTTWVCLSAAVLGVLASGGCISNMWRAGLLLVTEYKQDLYAVVITTINPIETRQRGFMFWALKTAE